MAASLSLGADRPTSSIAVRSTGGRWTTGPSMPGRTGSVPLVWWSTTQREQRPDIGDAASRRRPAGAPVGRRVFLGSGRPGRRRRAARRPGPGLARARGRPAHLQGRHRPRVAAPDRSLPHLHRHRRACRRAAAPTSRLRGARPRRPRRSSSRYDELAAMPATTLTRDFQCVTGWRVHDVRVEGRAALATCSTAPACRPDAKALRFHSFDGAYTESLTLSQARRDDVIVAYQLEGDAALRRCTAGRCASTSRRCTATSR